MERRWCVKHSTDRQFFNWISSFVIRCNFLECVCIHLIVTIFIDSNPLQSVGKNHFGVNVQLIVLKMLKFLPSRLCFTIRHSKRIANNHQFYDDERNCSSIESQLLLFSKKIFSFFSVAGKTVIICHAPDSSYCTFSYVLSVY